ncbi:MAG TPA: hypothetical protein DEH02_08850 [Bacteroidales bacterium]|nr:MAG: hypothetical protein A2X01_20310 [Bacteroidetes bacterium GWF2_35_48]OFY93552.1 MAG: hypothetical protein A2491_09305 [Bacteroidetes bacterium RIFOXYC12_FULL_35_7]HBX51159.1 hypothetical protein [Bacteroidales bacterium]
MKTLNLFILLILLAFANIASAQKQVNTWYFGANAGLDFNNGAPVALTNGQINTSDCSSAISDEDGNLLFYTDGQKVWNRNHQIMPNGIGLMGHFTAGTTALIVKQPGNNSLYYIFTVSEFASSNGFRYSVVDMTLQNGYGDITIKNILLISPATEKIAAVKHNNNADIWVMAHAYNSNAFHAYLLTESGLSASPVISNVGQTHTGGYDGTYNAMGQMKFSLDGSRLALGVYDLGVFEIFNFDNITGQVSNPRTINGYSKAWGVEFSQDGTKLYTTQWMTTKVWQFDLSVDIVSVIASSATLVGNATGPDSQYDAGFLQMGPDHKIYIAKWDSDFLGVIENPNLSGASCSFINDAVYLNGSHSSAGLVNFVQSLFVQSTLQVDFVSQGSCEGYPVSFSLTDSVALDSVLWCFGDTASGVYNTSSLLNPEHIYELEGIYSVSLTCYSSGNALTVTHTINIHGKPLINLGTDTSVCYNGLFYLDAGNSGASYLWNTGNTGQFQMADSTALYYVQVTDIFGCINSDTIFVNTNYLDLDSFTAVVNAMTCNFSVPDLSNTAYFWEFGDGNVSNQQNPSHTYQNSGIFFVCLTILDTINLCQATFCSDIAIGDTSNRCNAVFDFTISGNTVSFTNLSTGNPTDWVWNFGDASISYEENPQHEYASSGIYTVSLTIFNKINGCMDFVQQVIVIDASYDCEANFNYYSDITCNTINFSNQSIGANLNNFLWNFGDGETSTDQNPAHIYTSPGMYEICLSVWSSTTNCYDISCQQLLIGNGNNTCNANFIYIVDTTNNAVQFIDQSVGNPNQWHWNFGDGGHSDEQNPVYIYSEPGFFHVHLNIKNLQNGCISHKNEVINVSSGADSLNCNFIFLTDSLSKSNEFPVKFQGAAFGNPSKYLWDFGDEIVDSTTISPTHIYTQEGTFTVCLTVSDNMLQQSNTLCQNLIIGSNTIVKNEVQNYFTVYPNPAIHDAFISYFLNKSGQIKISIIDPIGKKTILQSNIQEQGKHTYEINLKEFSVGLYVIQLESESGVVQKKIIISR